MVVRARRDSDALTLLQIAERVHALDGYPPYLPNDDYRVLLFGHETLSAWVAEIDGSPVGQVALHPRTGRPAMALAAEALRVQPDELGVVARLLVGPDHRRRGVGRALLDVAARDGAERGLFPILDVATHLHGAIDLYERCGWSRAGEVEVQLPNGALREFVYIAPPSLRPRASM